MAGPEAANNAAAAGVLAPLLSLGPADLGHGRDHAGRLPAVRAAAGPLLFESNPELVWGMIASLYIGNVLLLVLNLPMAAVWVKLLEIPRPWLYGGILVFATLGAYTLNNNVVDLVILWIIGLLGFGMRVLDVPVRPAWSGLILGPLAEQQFRRALAISQGDPSVFFTHPISLALLHRGAPGARPDPPPGDGAAAADLPAETPAESVPTPRAAAARRARCCHR